MLAKKNVVLMSRLQVGSPAHLVCFPIFTCVYVCLSLPITTLHRAVLATHKAGQACSSNHSRRPMRVIYIFTICIFHLCLIIISGTNKVFQGSSTLSSNLA
ncbi:hypothetical protein DsansV1_C07g0069901 [Dioscorea sansibarensis]